jgi:hypothetical protein
MKRVCNTCHGVKLANEFKGESYRCNDCQSIYDLGKIDSSEYVRNRRKVDPLFKLKMNILSRTNSALKSSFWQKGSNNEKLLGANRDTVIMHIENKFKEGMTWSNRKFWHIDHIVPLSSATTEEQLYNLANYKNLSPEWKDVNLKKSGKIPDSVLRFENERDKAGELVSLYYLQLDAGLDISISCALNTIDFMLTNSMADIFYWEQVKKKIISRDFDLHVKKKEIDYTDY